MTNIPNRKTISQSAELTDEALDKVNGGNEEYKDLLRL